MPEPKLVNTVSGLTYLLDGLATVAVNPPPLAVPALYFDIRGAQVDRNGSISIISLHFLPKAKTYLIDIKTLGSAAFSTQNREEYSIKSILEFAGIPKVFFDVRNASDALFGLYGISVAGARELQLMELAFNQGRPYPRLRASSLVQCIERDLQWTKERKDEWLEIKTKAHRIFDPEKGGSYDVFNQRPLDKNIIQYCFQNVACLPELWKVYAREVCDKPGAAFWRGMIRNTTKNRVEQSHGKGFNSEATRKAEVPWDQENIDHETENWNDDVWSFATVDPATLTEFSFGIFEWLQKN